LTAGATFVKAYLAQDFHLGLGLLCLYFDHRLVPCAFWWRHNRSVWISPL